MCRKTFPFTGLIHLVFCTCADISGHNTAWSLEGPKKDTDLAPLTLAAKEGAFCPQITAAYAVTLLKNGKNTMSSYSQLM